MNEENKEGSWTKMGVWWLPQNPENRIPGIISFGGGQKISLKITGAFHDTFNQRKILAQPDFYFETPIIFGVTEDGKKYIANDCKEYHHSIMFGGELCTTSNLYVSSLFEGEHFPSASEILFNEFTCQLSFMSSWYQVTGKTLDRGEMKSDRFKIGLSYEQPENLSIPFPGGLMVIGNACNMNAGWYFGDFVLSEKTQIIISLDEPVGLEQFLYDWLLPIKYFFSLGVGRKLDLFELHAKTASDCAGKTLDERREVSPIRIYKRNISLTEDEKLLLDHDMVFTFPKIREQLIFCFNNWLRAYKEIKPVIHLFFGQVLGCQCYSPITFLNAVQTAEAYHRYRRNGLADTEEKHRERMKEICEAIPEQHRQWLKERLQYANEKGLRKRLKELLEENIDLFGYSTEEINTLAQEISVMRNYFTHYSGGKSLEEFHLSHFYYFHFLMQWIVTSCFLNELGLPRSQVIEMLLRNRAFLYFRGIELKKYLEERVSTKNVKKLLLECSGDAPHET